MKIHLDYLIINAPRYHGQSISLAVCNAGKKYAQEIADFVWNIVIATPNYAGISSDGIVKDAVQKITPVGKGYNLVRGGLFNTPMFDEYGPTGNPFQSYVPSSKTAWGQ